METRLSGPRMVGPFVNPDHFAVFLAACLPVMMALLSQRWSARSAREDPGSRAFATVLLVLGSTILVAALVGTGSRGGIAVAMVGALGRVARRGTWLATFAL